MLDISFIGENKKKVALAIKHKGIKLDVDELLKVDADRLKVLRQIEELNAQRNIQAKKIKEAGAKPNAAQIANGRKLKDDIARLEPELKAFEQRYQELMLLVPNIPSADTPVGKSEADNKEIRRWSEPTKFDFVPLDHVAIGERLGLLDIERGVKVGGFRGYFLREDLVRLQWALFSYCLDVMNRKGYQLLIPPTMVRGAALVGSGHFPAGREEVYQVGDDKFLVGTSEPSVLDYRSEEIVSLDELPLKYCAVSPCYRREIGSYGKDTKGLYRVHEFMKVEQVVICPADLDLSLKLFEGMLAVSEEILQGLGLPYRVLAICTADMGAGKYKMYDVETWMPSRASYGETHSCSHLTDWQARRLQLRYKDDKGVIRYPHTMNNTVIASPRILIALLENHQQADGSVAVPEVLRPYLGGQTEIR